MNDSTALFKRQILSFLAEYGMSRRGLSLRAGLGDATVGKILNTDQSPTLYTVDQIRRVMAAVAKEQDGLE